MAAVSRCGSLRADVTPQQPAGVHGLMLALGMVKPVKEQDCSPLAWKEEVALAGTFPVSLDFYSVLLCGAVALSPWPPLALSQLPGPPALAVQVLMCTVAGQMDAHPQGVQKGWMDCEDPMK